MQIPLPSSCLPLVGCLAAYNRHEAEALAAHGITNSEYAATRRLRMTSEALPASLNVSVGGCAPGSGSNPKADAACGCSPSSGGGPPAGLPRPDALLRLPTEVRSTMNSAQLLERIGRHTAWQQDAS